MIRRLATDRRGGVAILVAGGMAVLLGLSATAIDLGSVYLDSRRLQGVADAAALAAAGDIARAAGAADGAVAANRFPARIAIVTETGRYTRDTATAPAARFTAGAAQPDAARVTLTSRTPLWFAGMVTGRRSMTIRRRATAARTPQASFSIGTRLAAVNGGVANALLAKLAGGNVALSVADYDALIAADVDLFAFSNALRTGLRLTGASYAETLATETTLPVLLQAVATALDAQGKTAAATAARKLAAGSASRALLPSRLIDMGSLGKRTSVPATGIAVGAFDLAQAAIQTAGGARQVTVDLGLTIPGLGATKLWVATGERPAGSPWLAVTATGTPVVRTAQTRLYLETTLGVLGLTDLAAIRLPLYVELAEARASLTGLTCAGTPPSAATLAVTPSIGHASIAAIATGDLDRFTTAPPESAATLASVSLVLTQLTVKGSARVDLGGASAQSVPFSRAEVDARTIKTVSTNDAVASIAASLTSRINLTVAGLPLAGVSAAIGNTLALAAPVLDGLLGGVMNLLGLHLGQADVRMNAIRCGIPVLVG